MRRRRRSSDAASEALAATAAAARATEVDKESEAAPAAAPDPRAAAFFDCDNTLMAGASAYWYARGLAARKFFTGRDLARFAWQQAKYRASGKENVEGLADAREAALAFVAGRSVAEIVTYGEEIYDELMAERIYSGTRALTQAHLDAGQRVWLVTATPVELASIIARRLGLTGALGTVAEVSGGLYTGRLVGAPMHGMAKAEAIRALAYREGLELERCSAYSDSINDVPMLSAVGHPTAVNPDSDLKAYAKEHGWPVRDFRTGRKAVKVAGVASGGAGMLTGAVIAGVALRRRMAS